MFAKKNRRMSYAEAQRNVKDSIHALEKGEDRRVKLLEESVQRETRRLQIDERRLKVE